MIAGLLISARATATRCCSPQKVHWVCDSYGAKDQDTLIIFCFYFCFFLRFVCNKSGDTHVFESGKFREQLMKLKYKTKFRFLNLDKVLSFMVKISSLLMRNSIPLSTVGLSKVPKICNSVVFPARGTHDGDNFSF
jgi:hypothetical protein